MNVFVKFMDWTAVAAVPCVRHSAVTLCRESRLATAEVKSKYYCIKRHDILLLIVYTYHRSMYSMVW
jgi:hypothetical protein